MSESNTKLCFLQEEIGGSKEQEKKYYALSDDLQENASLPQNNSVEHDSLLSLENKRRKKKKSLHSSMSNEDDFQEGRHGAYDNNTTGNDLQENALLLQSTVENDLVYSYGKERKKPKRQRSSVSNNDADNGLQERRDASTTLDSNALDANIGENALLLQNGPPESDMGLSSGKKKRRKQKGLQSSVSNIKTDHALQEGRDSVLNANHDLEEGRCGPWDNNTVADDLQENILLLQSTVENDLVSSYGKKKRRNLKSLHSSISNNDTDNGLQERRDAALDNNALDPDLGENALLLQNGPPDSDMGMSSGKKKRRKQKDLHKSASNIKTGHVLQEGRDSVLDANHDLEEGRCGAWDHYTAADDVQENILLLQSTVENDLVSSCGKKKSRKLKRQHNAISNNDTDNGLQEGRDTTLDDNALDPDLGENALLLQNGKSESDLCLSSGKKKRRKQKDLHISASNIKTDHALEEGRDYVLDANHDLEEGRCGAWDNNTVGDDLQENILLLQSTIENDLVSSYGKKQRRKLKRQHSSSSNNDTENGLQEGRDTTLDNNALDADLGENALLLQNCPPESDLGLSSGKKKRRKQKGLHSSISNIKTDHSLQEGRDSVLDANHDLEEGRCGKDRKKPKRLHSSVSNNDTDNGLQEKGDTSTTLDSNALDADLGENALLLQNAPPESDMGLSSGKKKRRKQKCLHSSGSNIKTDHALQEGRDSVLDKIGMGAVVEENALSLQNTPVGNDLVLSVEKKDRKKRKKQQNEEDNLPQRLRLSPERPFLESSIKKLLILDLNGLLVDVVPSVSKGYIPDIRVNRKAVFKRPFCDNFLQFCFEKFDVGVWTSRTKTNMNIVLNYLFGKSKQQLVFCWHRQHCSCTPFNTLEYKKKPLVLKQLKQLWEYQGTGLPWKKGYYNESNTVLFDDSPYKALRNPLHTGIFPEPYSYKNNEDNSLGPGGDIRCYLEGLAMAENVQKYIEQNPFGQQAITEADPQWDFYSKVLVCEIHRC